MGGSGGGNFFSSNRNSSDSAKQLRELERNKESIEFKKDVSEFLGGLLKKYNDRDVASVNQRLDRLIVSVEDIVEGSIQLSYGGSVAKHTYIDGISDIDCLLKLSSESGISPKDLLELLVSKFSRAFPECEISHGKIAVTIVFGDGMQLQILPALSHGEYIKVPDWDGKQWSNIDPEKFTEKLAKVNEECSGKLVPAIKLIKAINSTLPERIQLSGYHIESMAIDIFKKYSGVKDPKSMLEYFFSSSRETILGPIKDSTGQSVHVDEYMGEANSKNRMMMSGVLNRIYNRLENANARNSISAWKVIFDEE